MDLHRSLTAEDAPRITLLGLLLLTLLFGARFMTGRVSAQREQQATIARMNLEMGRGPEAKTDEVPESQPGQGDPNFVW